MKPDAQSQSPWLFDNADIVNIYPVQLMHSSDND